MRLKPRGSYTGAVARRGARRAAEGEILSEHGGLGIPPAHLTRNLSQLRNVTPGEEAPAQDQRCIHGFADCSFGPAHAHMMGRGSSTTVMSPAGRVP